MATLTVAAKAGPEYILPIVAVASCVQQVIGEAALSVTFAETETVGPENQKTKLVSETGKVIYDESIISYLRDNHESLRAGDKTQVDEWMARSVGFRPLDFKQLEKPLKELDNHLTLRSYICGYGLTVADLVCWATLRGNRVVLTSLKKGTNSLSRWFNFIEGSYPWITYGASQLVAGAMKKKVAASAAGGNYNIGLPDTEGGVVTRFPPEPSGYLHIGHAKAALLNDYFAHERYGGTLICRFDDTNPSKEKEEFQDAIREDLAMLGIYPDKTSFSSDYFKEMYDYCVEIIKSGNAYADDTEKEKMGFERREGIASERRDESIEKNLARLEEMKAGTEEGRRWCIRAKISVDNPNKAMRDPVIYRCNQEPHHRTGTAWKIYPTYDFCVPILDSLEGVTHALRTTEYGDRNDQYAWMQKTLGLRSVYIWDFARVNFIRTLLSKRKLTQIVDQGTVWGWDDPRMPTIRGILRRGMTVPALREFILKQGPSRNIINMDWSSFWAFNKKYIDPVAPRHTAIILQDAVTATVQGADGVKMLEKPKHVKNPDVGQKKVYYSSKILLEQIDAKSFAANEEITLMNWGNAFVRKIEVDQGTGLVTGLELELHLEGDVKKTDKKVTWLSKDQDLVAVKLYEFDYLITKDKLEKEDSIEEFLNPNTESHSDAVGDCNVAELAVGDIIQFERNGYYRLDKRSADGQPAILFKIPDALHSAITSASRLTPPVLPLIVRNPYLSTWLADARQEPWAKWPIFWTGQNIGLSLMAQVPSTKTIYPLLGRPHDSLGSNHPNNGYNVSFPKYLGAKYDASTTNLTYSLLGAHSQESLDITVSFLSPITPTSTLRQSIPASYVTVYVTGNLDVSIYMDMNGQWVSGDRGSAIVWRLDNIIDKEKELNLHRWQVRRQPEMLFTEFSDRAEWGSLHFIAPSDVRYESGISGELRTRFARTGVLQNLNDEIFRTIMDREPVFAYAKSFNLSGLANNGTHWSNDTVESSYSYARQGQVTFSIAHIQDPVVQFASSRGLTHMKPLWTSWFPSEDALLAFHYFDFKNARVLADKYSKQLAQDALLSAAEDYVDIVALSARQVLGATSFSGTAENPILFLKEISSNGNCQTVDVIFPSFPFFLYTNPRWLAYLLEPLIEHMLSGQYPNDYSMHDLGSHFPNMTGHPDGKDEYMPVEECGNMLLMGLAIVNSLRYPPERNSSAPWHPGTTLVRGNATEAPGLFPLTDLQTVGGIDRLDIVWGAGPDAKTLARKWVERSYRLWKQWTGYLVKFALEPHNQLSTDDFAGWLALQTNLALKGIIGIKAMSELAGVVGNAEDKKHYQNISDVYISKWEGFGFSRDNTHAKVSYNWHGSWTTLYNMFADALLCFHLEGTEESMHIATDDHYGQEPFDPNTDSDTNPEKKIGFIPRHVYTKQSQWYHNVRQKYGLPLDSRHLYAKTDWEFFAMAVSSTSVRHEILQSVAKWVNETSTDRPLTDLHQTEGDGGFPGPNFFARPVVGGHFAFLALEKACNGKATDGLKFLDQAGWEVPPEEEDDWVGCDTEACEHDDGWDHDHEEEDKPPIEYTDGTQVKLAVEQDNEESQDGPD
ncbi:hypothetical protein FQN57_004745 [Myotisia sp. PD_48]|nr:hypothetical protein FQN57_004745 [Myotisia sp. PD_48]